MKFTLNVLLFVLALSFPSVATSQVVCMVSDVDGHVELNRNNVSSQQINRFKKLSAGDKVELSKSTTLRLSYLAIGRHETWKGPVTIIIQAQEARDMGNKVEPTVATFGNVVTALKSSKILNSQNELKGGILPVRSRVSMQFRDAALNAMGRMELEEIQASYKSIANKSQSGDITADIYYIGALEGLNQKARIASHILKLLKDHGDNPDLTALLYSIPSDTK